MNVGELLEGIQSNAGLLLGVLAVIVAALVFAYRRIQEGANGQEAITAYIVKLAGEVLAFIVAEAKDELTEIRSEEVLTIAQQIYNFPIIPPWVRELISSEEFGALVLDLWQAFIRAQETYPEHVSLAYQAGRNRAAKASRG